MIFPKYLNDNDTIGITACSCGVLKKINKYEDSINNVKNVGKFNIVETNNRRGNLWRIFGREDCEENIASLPECTSLQRAYKKRLLENGEIGGARGFFFIKNNKFIKK